MGRVVVTPLRFMPSDKLSQSLWWLTTKSLLMNKANRKSRISLSSLIVPCLLLTQETNPRSLEVPEPEQDTRSLTVKLHIFISAVFIPSMFHLGKFLTVIKLHV